MNKLHKKKDAGKISNTETGAIPQGIDLPSTSELYYKKLGANLLLLYQFYLRQETLLEPEIKMALWRMIQLNEDFREKIRLLHLDYLEKDTVNLDAGWEDVKAFLFPMKEEPEAITHDIERDHRIVEYKEAVSELLSLNL